MSAILSRSAYGVHATTLRDIKGPRMIPVATAAAIAWLGPLLFR